MQREPISDIDKPLTSFVCFVFLFFVIFLFTILCYFSLSSFLFLPISYVFSFISDFLSFFTLSPLFPCTLITSFLQASLPFFLYIFLFALLSLFLYFHSSFLSSFHFTFICACSLLSTSSLVFLKECYRHTTQRTIFSVDNGNFTGMRSQNTLNASEAH